VRWAGQGCARPQKELLLAPELGKRPPEGSSAESGHVGSTEDEMAQLVESLDALFRCRPLRHYQDPDLLDGAVPGLGGYRRLPRQRCSSRCHRICWIRHAFFATFLTVTTIHFDNHHLLVVEEPGQTDSPRSGALNTHPPQAAAGGFSSICRRRAKGWRRSADRHRSFQLVPARYCRMRKPRRSRPPPNPSGTGRSRGRRVRSGIVRS